MTRDVFFDAIAIAMMANAAAAGEDTVKTIQVSGTWKRFAKRRDRPLQDRHADRSDSERTGLNSARRRFFFGGALLFFVGMQVGGAAEVSETYLSGGTRIKAERVFVREAVPSSRPLHSVSK